MIIGYIIAAAISLLAIVAAYCLEFVGRPGFEIVPDTSVWGNFGSYVGGLAGPVLSFISLLFLIRSLKLQNEANETLRNELRDSQKSEKLKSFSDLFFNLIDSQRALLDKFKLVFSENNIGFAKRGVEAIMKIEDEIAKLRGVNATNDQLRQYIGEVDPTDQIFGIVRAFYISVKLVSEKLGDAQGFSVAERKDFLGTLINLTDFAQLRLILLGIQLIDSKAAKYLRNEQEFVSVLHDVGLKLDPY
ncbi:hypothetical protein [Burkholderia ubonensis]|uniref:hypothetical protein n=1 Tax=Burkholderia ubonensis TaxID=101571 RepID=UPI0007C850F2|nr:hypothetical protein [Burkholderia ubonensis]